MIRSIHDPYVSGLFKSLREPGTKTVLVDGKAETIVTPFPSPIDWRDTWMYQLLIDRFDNPKAPPKASWNGHNMDVFQGGTFNGVRERLPYLRELGVTAIWLSPVLKNCQYLNTYHGYGVQDFLAIEPRFASDIDAARKDPRIAEEELQQLIDEAHARGIYIIFDIVLHHAGDVFAYVMEDGTTVATAPFRPDPYPVQWRDEHGKPRPDWADATSIPRDSADAGVWPMELRSNSQFHRQGDGTEDGADFKALKTIVTDGSTDSCKTLIRCCEYLVGKFDIDGLRVDAFKHIDKDFGRTFCSSLREFAASIGKKNFFIFCEVFDGDDMIAQYVGRNTVTGSDEMEAADAALDFPLMFVLPDVIQGKRSPAELSHMFDHRKSVGRHILGTHGETSRFFVTFLDNHDQYHRIYSSPSDDPHAFDDHLKIALGCLFTLQGIPCVYYGTEQGLRGDGKDDEAVREALWGAPEAFDAAHPFYLYLHELSELRARQAALRYGRQYFRSVSTDAEHFGIATMPGEPVAFSRILSEQEILIVANPSLVQAWTGQVIVDMVLNAQDEPFDVLFSNKVPTKTVAARTYRDGRARFVALTLRPGEIRILSNRH